MVKISKKKTCENSKIYPFSASTGVLTAGKSKILKMYEISNIILADSVDGLEPRYRSVIFRFAAQCVETQAARVKFILIAAQNGCAFTASEVDWDTTIQSALNTALDKAFSYRELKAVDTLFPSVAEAGTAIMNSKTVSINLTKQFNDMAKVLEAADPSSNPSFFLAALVVPFSTPTVSVLGWLDREFDVTGRSFSV